LAVCEKQGVWFSESCGYAPWEPPWYPEGIWVLGAVSNIRVTLKLNTEAGTGWQGVGLGFGVETRNERCSSSTTGADDRDL
jgi:hypothetical protein